MMAAKPISQFTALIGVDPVNDKIPIVDHSATKTKYVTPEELLAGMGIDTDTYQPIATLTSNLDAAVPSVAQYMRVSDAVTVWGHTTIDPTAAGPTATVLGLSLPVASNFSNSADAGGSAHSQAAADEHFVIYADATNDRVTFDGLARSAASHDIWFHFTYRVI